MKQLFIAAQTPRSESCFLFSCPTIPEAIFCESFCCAEQIYVEFCVAAELCGSLDICRQGF